MSKFAEKVWKEAHSCPTDTGSIAIIDAALKKQREAYIAVVHKMRPSEFFIGQSIVHAARDNALRDAEEIILNAEVEE